MVFPADAAVTAHRAVAFARRLPIPAIENMVDEVEKRERRETEQRGNSNDFSRLHRILLSVFGLFQILLCSIYHKIGRKKSALFPLRKRALFAGPNDKDAGD
jgi:hypothetical protein